MRSWLNKLVKYFVEGILIVIPFASTAVFILYCLNKFRQLLTFLVRHIPFFDRLSILPGLNILVICITIAFLGYLASKFIVRTVIDFLEGILLSIPIINILYSYTKETTSAFVDKFDNPVLITVNEALGIAKIGFITKDNLAALNIKNKVAVYIPHSYSFSGELNLVPNTNVTPLNASSASVLRFILTGGLADIEQPLVISKTEPVLSIDKSK